MRAIPAGYVKAKALSIASPDKAYYARNVEVARNTGFTLGQTREQDIYKGTVRVARD